MSLQIKLLSSSFSDTDRSKGGLLYQISKGTALNLIKFLENNFSQNIQWMFLGLSIDVHGIIANY